MKTREDKSSLRGEADGSTKEHGSAWGDRLRALKNVPPVLHLVWDSGPKVVFWNITIRIVVAFLPVAVGIIGRFIIDGVNRLRIQQPLPQNFWWLVGAELALAVLIGVLMRTVDYFDSLLADRYTHHVSVEVMRKAAALDVTVYEDPVFYDRLERARVQATDRLAMIQQMGRLIQQTVTAIAFSAVLIRYSTCAAFPFDCWNCAGVSRREPFCVSYLRQEFPSDTTKATNGLFEAGRRQQRSFEGTQAV